MQPKKQLKVQYIGIFEEIDSFYWPKMHFLKKGQKFLSLVDPPPSFGQCPDSGGKRFFSLKSSLSMLYKCKYISSLFFDKNKDHQTPNRCNIFEIQRRGGGGFEIASHRKDPRWSLSHMFWKSDTESAEIPEIDLRIYDKLTRRVRAGMC